MKERLHFKYIGLQPQPIPMVLHGDCRVLQFQIMIRLMSRMAPTVVVTDDALSATEDQCVTAESGAVTIGGTPAVNDICYFRIFRDVSDSNDDMTEDARLIGIKIFFTTDAANDA